MYPLFLYTCLFSCCAAVAVHMMEKRRLRGGHRITRFALLLLLIIPFLLLFPQWHVLPPQLSLVPWAEEVNQSSPRWLDALWLSGAMASLFRLTRSAWLLEQWRIKSTRIEDRTVIDLLHDCCRKLSCNREIELRALDTAQGPAACGLWRARIYLPADWSLWPTATLRAVILHEIGHHVSRDPLWRWISLIGSSLHWYNPFVHWLSRRLDLQSEMICDARVIESGFRREQYAHILCDLAAHAPYSAVALASPGGLERRVRHLGQETATLTRSWFAAGVAILSLAAIYLGILRPQQDPGAPHTPTPEDSSLRQTANPFPSD